MIYWYMYTWSCWVRAGGREVETRACGECCTERTCWPARTSV